VLIEFRIWWKQWRTHRRIDGAIRILEKQLKDRKNTSDLKSIIAKKIEILKLTKVDVVFDAAEPHITMGTEELTKSPGSGTEQII
jgi:hypothetical protein